jgi:thimet oligopeptidase
VARALGREADTALLLIVCFALIGPVRAAPSGPGIDWRLTPEQLEAECVAAVGTAYARTDGIAAGPEPAANDLSRLLAIEETVAALNDTVAAHTLLGSVAPDPALRAAGGECRDAVERFAVELAGHPAVYAIATRAATEARMAADRKLAQVYLESGRRAGAPLDGETRARVTELLAELGRLQLDFQRALAADRTSITISAAEAESLPPGLRSSFDMDGDRYVVPVTYGAINREFMARMASPAARRRYQTAFLNRGGPENLQRVQAALGLRREVARLSGYPDWAHYRLDTMMAGTPDRALSLINTVDTRLMAKADAEMATLEALKKQTGDDTPFAAWDYGYYQPLLERQRYGVDDAEIRQYFPVDRVIPEVLEIYETLFALRFERLPDGDDEWAPGVRLYAVREADGETPFAYFYLDLEPREGKFLSPANFPIRAGRRLSDGGYRAPVSSIIGNGPRRSPEEPAMFGHADLVQFFHEFGHVMHTTLSTAPYATLYGANTRRDFVEAPSQMLENWVWQPEVLRRLSGHFETGEPLPTETVMRMASLKRASTGVFWTRQAFLAAYDMTLHLEDPDIPANEHWFELMPRMTPLPPTPGTMPPASFMPIMGGYDANYYGYLWSRVYAQDLFSVFAAEGIDDPATGRRFRQEILAPGGSREPQELVREFLGRPVQYEAFYEELGASPKSSASPHR